MKQRPISHDDFSNELSRFEVEFAEFLAPHTTVVVKYEKDYRFHIYADFAWDSTEETLKGLKLRVKQLAKRERGDIL